MKRTRIIETVEELQSEVASYKKKGLTVGFAPTMGALHEGHMTLMDASNEIADITICSIFVNPTQFNEASDLEKYPRTVEQDVDMLSKRDVDIAFVPPVTEVYPKTTESGLKLQLNGMDKGMEGQFRPGHFEGVLQVVHRLLTIVQPDYLFMGQKDYQQFSLCAEMIRQTQLPVELKVVPIKREPDGVAMSSRNVRLTAEHRKEATVIFKTLKAVKRKKYQLTVPELEAYAMNRIGKKAGFRPEYFTICDGVTLQPVVDIRNTKLVVACTAAWAGEVRLIDNMIIKGRIK